MSTPTFDEALRAAQDALDRGDARAAFGQVRFHLGHEPTLATLPGETVASLAEHRPGQVVWAHASCWTTEPPFAADLTTYLYQHNVSPWGERLRFNAETREAENVPASTAPPEARAAEVLAAALEADAVADVPKLTELAQTVQRLGGEHATGGWREEGRRRRQGTNSPVLSSRFL